MEMITGFDRLAREEAFDSPNTPKN